MYRIGGGGGADPYTKEHPGGSTKMTTRAQGQRPGPRAGGGRAEP